MNKILQKHCSVHGEIQREGSSEIILLQNDFNSIFPSMSHDEFLQNVPCYFLPPFHFFYFSSPSPT